ncbi:hypothetical protein IC620_15990 [Hazenella sp. IB182357]|uniref:Uncharacterized protein n=1 Tax=Polycladospora coralii TaxID=2771432 RepID=A0A926RYV0_9BACL|nr:hypothetical protein [Polycladospora coralii]MBD1373846.1 hypothetical protein [Polycladospora coralii]
MTVKKMSKLISAFVLSILVTFSVQGEVFAGSTSVFLSGSGPVYSSNVSPGDTSGKLYISNYTSLNVGFDLFDQNGNKVANGTVKDYGDREYNVTFHSGKSYYLRLRCQEPIWNNTKCRAKGIVEW